MVDTSVVPNPGNTITGSPFPLGAFLNTPLLIMTDNDSKTALPSTINQNLEGAPILCGIFMCRQLLLLTKIR